ncbi:MAG: hypothetical protein ABI600_02080, partial [Luteolibacter sp.]
MQTATETIDLRSVQGQIEALKTAIATVRAGEAVLIKKQAEGLVAVRKEMARREEADAEKLNARIHELTAIHHQTVEALNAATQKRQARIHQTYHASKSTLAQRMQEMKDRRIGQVQGVIMRNRQQRQQQLEIATEAHREFQTQLLADRGVRHALRDSVLRAFRSFKPLLRGKFEGTRMKVPEIDSTGSPEETRKALLEALDEARVTSDVAAALPLVRFFRFIPLSFIASLVAGMHLWYGLRPGSAGLQAVLPSFLIAEGVLIVVWILAYLLARSTARSASASLAAARVLEVLAEKKSAARLAGLTDEIKGEHEKEGQNLSETFRESDTDWKTRLATGQKKLDQQLARLPGQLEKLHQRKLGKLTDRYEHGLSNAREDARKLDEERESARRNANAAVENETDTAIDGLTVPWQGEVLPKLEKLLSLDHSSRARFPEWSSDFCENWAAPEASPESVRIGSLHVDAAKLAGGLPHDPGFHLADAANFLLPYSLSFPSQGSVMIESDGKSGDAATLALNAIALRL